MVKESDKVVEGLSSSLEDYLETIYLIIVEKEAVRPKDIAGKLNISNASVTGALKTLSDKGMVNYAPYDIITLTPSGRKAAMDIIRRHDLLKDFFVKILGVDKDTAEKTAHTMEHDIDPLVIDRLAKFTEFVEVCPRGGIDWVSGINFKCDNSVTPEICSECILDVFHNFKEKQELRTQENFKGVSLSSLKPGQRGKIIKVSSKGALSKRMVEMGLILGTVVEVERVAPLGDPIELKVKGYKVSLRKEEASKIDVEII